MEYLDFGINPYVQSISMVNMLPSISLIARFFSSFPRDTYSKYKKSHENVNLWGVRSTFNYEYRTISLEQTSFTNVFRSYFKTNSQRKMENM